MTASPSPVLDHPPDLLELIDQMMRPHDNAAISLRRELLLKLLSRPRTVRELRTALSLPTHRAVVDLLAELERQQLVQPGETRARLPRADQIWELHPLFLTHIGQKPAFWSPSEGATAP